MGQILRRKILICQRMIEYSEGVWNIFKGNSKGQILKYILAISIRVIKLTKKEVSLTNDMFIT